MRVFVFLVLLLASYSLFSQQIGEKVNVFLGTSGDHGQLSPAASSPFSMLSIGPQTYPSIHTGYEYKAKKFLGFTHTRMEGVGCMGNGGNILITPSLISDTILIKKQDISSPGFYKVEFDNGLMAQATTLNNFGIYNFRYPAKGKIKIDLSHSFVNGFVNSEYKIHNNIVTGFVQNKTTCSVGEYKIYFAIKFPETFDILELKKNNLEVYVNQKSFNVGVALSSVGADLALSKIKNLDFDNLKKSAQQRWETVLSKVEVEGDEEDEALFYSLLYRGHQSPFNVTESNGTYRAIDGLIHETSDTIYNGFAIWDNYREQIPMLSIVQPNIYEDVALSIANLYPYGKGQWPTKHETSPTVRNEHALVVLLDALNKGVYIPVADIQNEIIREVESIEPETPDKWLEYSYDLWAAGKLLETFNAKYANDFLANASNYKEIWNKDFKDINAEDVDKMQARGLYQGTIWQYRWFVPYDVEGLINLIGNEDLFIKQLDEFFEGDYYNHANQPDLQVPGLYNSTSQPWKSQRLFRKILKEDVIQFYFNDNSRGIDSHIGRIYNNRPDAYLRTMDDDAGTMSSWWVLRSLGLSPVNVGEPYFYITSPIFESYQFNLPNNKKFAVQVENQKPDNHYIQKVFLNNKRLQRNWITYDEIMKGGNMRIILGDAPNKSAFSKVYKTSLNSPE
ncbi:MAG: glycoside hydrolase domain-containing protein [Weeksellaceae bacterium]